MFIIQATGGYMGIRYLLQLLLGEKLKIANNSVTTEAG
jgi:hypothetical protein